MIWGNDRHVITEVIVVRVPEFVSTYIAVENNNDVLRHWKYIS
jgi:hypothetical protein